ncbi:MAG: hypothetical protein F8N39_14255, partial [Clostridiaceae bacterium]|nr:hypothetical protein [Clostridiaceae bacterium]
SYVLPMGEGKLIPSGDSKWKQFLDGADWAGNESLSMQFFAANKEKYSVVYVIENMFNNDLNFDTKDKIKFSFSHEFPSINKEKEYGFRIYVTSKNPVDITAVYKNYIKEKGKFTTLEEKAKSNENIKKLYGAPHIYLWGDGASIDLLKDMNKSGIKNAWLGFDSWTTGTKNPEFVKYANENGYLIGTYDSYHSIQETGNENWETASFKDKSLYENATITRKNGKKVGGFLGKGRKLNPTLSMPAVKERVEDILSTGVKFNSWFIDCDATGEFYDDYSPNHITTQQQDMQARLKRMEYIRDNKKMVIGSEGGNDYASQTIAFAHGIEASVPSWGDKDMRENKDSQYYVGGYWAPKGEIPPIYSKQVPIKDLYKSIYIDPAYSLPLYKLVYNNSVITTHHWESGSLKIKDEVKDIMLYEVLYNVPPLYHLDKKTWSENKSIIASHINIWAPFHKKAITQEMTDFKVLSQDKLVQMTEYGKDLKVVANFSDKDFKYGNDVVKAKSLIIYDSGKEIKYTP